MTDIKYSGMNYSIKPSLHVSSRILIVNADFPCKMIRLQIICQLEIWLANALVGKRSFLIDRSVSYTKPLVCFQGLFLKSGCALCVKLGLLCITFGFTPGLLVCLGTALAESEQTQKADHGFGWCLLSVKLYLVGTACTNLVV